MQPIDSKQMLDPFRHTAPRTRPMAYVAEDDVDTRDALTELLVHDGLMVRAAPDGARLFDWLFRDRDASGRLPDVIITDHRMPGFCSLDIVDALVENEWDIPVIIVTAFGREVRGLVPVPAQRAVHVLEKPFEPDALRSLTRRCLAWRAGQLSPHTSPAAERQTLASVRRAVTTADDG